METIDRFSLEQIADPDDMRIDPKEEDQNRLETKMNNRRELYLHFQAAFR